MAGVPTVHRTRPPTRDPYGPDVVMARLTDTVHALLQTGPTPPADILISVVHALHSAHTGLHNATSGTRQACRVPSGPLRRTRPPACLCSGTGAWASAPGQPVMPGTDLLDLVGMLVPRTVGWPPPVAYFLTLKGHVHAAVFLLRHEAGAWPPPVREDALRLLEQLTTTLIDRVWGR